MHFQRIFKWNIIPKTKWYHYKLLDMSFQKDLKKRNYAESQKYIFLYFSFFTVWSLICYFSHAFSSTRHMLGHGDTKHQIVVCLSSQINKELKVQQFLHISGKESWHHCWSNYCWIARNTFHSLWLYCTHEYKQIDWSMFNESIYNGLCHRVDFCNDIRAKMK